MQGEVASAVLVIKGYKHFLYSFMPEDVNWLRIFGLCLGVKLFFLMLDPTPMFYMGDSGSYIHTAMSGWKPPDRSYLYGLLIGPLILFSNSLFPVVVLQTLSGCVVATCFACLAFRLANIRAVWIYLLAIVIAVEPFLLTYERFVMTESLSLMCFSLFVYALLSFIASNKQIWLLASLLFGGLAIAMRTAFFPVCLVLLSGIVIWHAVHEVERWKRPVTRYVVATIMVVLVAFVFNFIQRPQTKHGGYFWMASVAPLIKQKHLSAAGIPTEILDGMPCNFDDLAAREGHRWQPDCLVDRIYNHHEKNHGPAVSASMAIATAAIRDDPLGFLGLGFKTYARFWDNEVVEKSIYRDLGRRPLRVDFQEMLTNVFGHHYPEYESMKTFSRTYLEYSNWWARLLLLTPLLFLALVFLGKNKAPVFLLLLATLGYGATICLFVTDNVVRYLHPLAPFFVLGTFCLFSHVKKNRFRV